MEVTGSGGVSLWEVNVVTGSKSAYQRRLINRNRRVASLFLLPNLIGFLVFMFVPIIMSFGISFTNWDGFNEIQFVGIDNFKKMFLDEGFRISLKNTLYYSVFFVPLTLVAALLAAAGLNCNIKGIKFYRTAFFLPYITATVAVVVVWQLLYHPSMGPINSFLMAIGIENPPKWLSSSKWAMPAVIITSVWKNVGYYMIIFLAGLQGISAELYEAADLDGADSLQKFWYVTIPLLRPIIFFVSIITVINSFKVFDMVYMLTNGGPGRATNVLVYSIYTEGFRKYNFGYASAMAYVLFLMIMVVTMIQFRGEKKWGNE